MMDAFAGESAHSVPNQAADIGMPPSGGAAAAEPTDASSAVPLVPRVAIESQLLIMAAALPVFSDLCFPFVLSAGGMIPEGKFFKHKVVV